MPVKRSAKVHKFHEGTGDDQLPTVSMQVVNDGSEMYGIIEIELFMNRVPKACEFFLQSYALPVTGDRRNAKRSSCKACKFVRLTNEILQVGDRSGSRSVPICEVEMEIGRVSHAFGFVSLCRSSTSFDESFFFCLTNDRLELDSLDKRHIAFGRVVDGLDVIMNLTRALIPHVEEGCVIFGDPYTISEVVPKQK
uniref:Peptidyl-prolyl cis-trans isomerase n=1 Tax=Trypanosoma congolense (strain IL3000) TaxID=1068625 RepID=G0USU1_TRYCI|nr:putative cyclophilin [Trypanosoma congolense IL3000]